MGILCPRIIVLRHCHHLGVHCSCSLGHLGYLSHLGHLVPGQLTPNLHTLPTTTHIQRHHERRRHRSRVRMPIHLIPNEVQVAAGNQTILLHRGRFAVELVVVEIREIVLGAKRSEAF